MPEKTPLGITELALRDAHQSLLATRLRIDDMLPIAAELDAVGFWSMESCCSLRVACCFFCLMCVLLPCCSLCVACCFFCLMYVLLPCCSLRVVCCFFI